MQLQSRQKSSVFINCLQKIVSVCTVVGGGIGSGGRVVDISMFGAAYFKLFRFINLCNVVVGGAGGAGGGGGGLCKHV